MFNNEDFYVCGRDCEKCPVYEECFESEYYEDEDNGCPHNKDSISLDGLFIKSSKSIIDCEDCAAFEDGECSLSFEEFAGDRPPDYDFLLDQESEDRISGVEDFPEY